MGVLIYSGGFAPIGGIETFLFDLALHLHRRNLSVSVCCWGAPNALLNQLMDEGIAVTRLPFLVNRFAVQKWSCSESFFEQRALPGFLVFATANGGRGSST
jgi:hypothetical protein